MLYFWIKKDQDIANPLNKHNIFDVVAGTSIGAINAHDISWLCHGKPWFMASDLRINFWIFGSMSLPLRSN